MKILVTGSLGNIGKPLTKELVAKGHTVTVVSSNPERKNAIESLGATAAVGSIEDCDFLTSAFSAQDAVFTMLPQENYADPNLDFIQRECELVDNYARAIEKSGARHIVHLSSVGAHLERGNGLLRAHHNAETVLNQLPSEVSITFIRPTSFYYNLFGFVEMIQQQGLIAANYGVDDFASWAAPSDIAGAIGAELLSPQGGRTVRYVASDELGGDETAKILGAAIGKPDLKWIIIPDEQMHAGLLAAGMNPNVALGLVEMYAACHSGLVYEDYHRHRPALGTVKMADFARDFAAVYGTYHHSNDERTETTQV